MLKEAGDESNFYSQSREEGCKEEQRASIRCHSHHDFRPTEVTRVRKQHPGPVAERKPGQKHCATQKAGRGTHWGCLGITCVLHGAG